MTKSYLSPDLTLIFDLDGTLVDTAPDILDALNHALAHVTDSRLTMANVRDMIGMGAPTIIEEGLDLFGIPHDEAQRNALREKFQIYYFDNIAKSSTLFPGLDPLLQSYTDAGVRLGVCTNKLQKPSAKLLTALGVHDHFHTIVGRDTFDHFKPDPRTLLRTIEQAGGNPERTVYLGDSITDVKTAKAASIPCVLVSFGYTKEPVESLGGDALIDHFDELDEVVRTLVS